MAEHWCRIGGYSDYFVSNMGRVKSLKKNKAEKILSGVPNTGGYLSVNLCKNGIASMRMIHRLVLVAFIIPPSEGYQCNHKNGIKTEKMLEGAVSVEWVETNSELEALILEDNIIKELRPKYNILLKDSKTFQYIKVTLDKDYPASKFVVGLDLPSFDSIQNIPRYLHDRYNL